MALLVFVRIYNSSGSLRLFWLKLILCVDSSRFFRCQFPEIEKGTETQFSSYKNASFQYYLIIIITDEGDSQLIKTIDLGHICNTVNLGMVQIIHLRVNFYRLSCEQTIVIRNFDHEYFINSVYYIWWAIYIQKHLKGMADSMNIYEIVTKSWARR